MRRALYLGLLVLLVAYLVGYVIWFATHPGLPGITEVPDDGTTWLAPAPLSSPFSGTASL